MGVQAVIAAAAVVGAGASVQSGQRQKAANKAQQKQADARAAAERRRMVREERIRRSQVINASTQTGGQGSSGEFGALAGITSQTGANLAQSYQQQTLSQSASKYLQGAANFNTLGNVASTVGSTASMFK